MALDDLDKKLLNALQKCFPLHREPFAALGLELGLAEEKTIQRIERLEREGIVRAIGPVFDPRRLGYQSTLAAMQLPQHRLEEAARVVSQHPGVSHNYARDHQFNLWFTLAIPRNADLQGEVEELGRLARADAVLNLPAVRLFKIGAFFDVAGDGQTLGNTCDDGNSTEQAELSAIERAVVNELQQDLRLVSRPFDSMAAPLGLEVEEFLGICRALQRQGIMRRFGALIRHDRVGFVANGMACWVAPPAMVSLAARRLAAFPEVSHCYERQTNPLWPYNLFAMIHGRSPDFCHELAAKVSRETGLKEYRLLFSTKEFKRTRVKYLV